MKLTESIIDGLIDIRSHIGRTLLQVFGIILGVASVVATNSMISGGQQKSLDFYEEIGGLRKLVVTNHSISKIEKTALELAGEGLVFDDLEPLTQSEYIERIEPGLGRRLELSFRRFKKQWFVEGVTPNYPEVFNFHVHRGRFINNNDLKNRTRVVVLGTAVARRMFGTADPIGKTVYIDGHGCSVVGIMEEKYFEFNEFSKNVLEWMNEKVFIPVTTLAFSFVGTQQLSSLNIQIADIDKNEQAKEDITRILRRNHRGIEDFKIYDRKERIEQHRQESLAFSILFSTTGAIALVVGGIVIMNILLASFYERIREVGIRKALGATWIDVIAQFLVESVVITIIGGFIGLILGIFLVKVIHQLTGQSYPIPAGSLILAFVFSVSVGIIFGFYPAVKAARLNPVEALRYE